ncbi:MAG TPA: hypothetical protein VH540_03720 [Ktedonobacterales bacterium]|jgi:hypothetical protein
MAHIDLFPPDERHPLAYFMARYPTLHLPNPEPIYNAISLLSPHMDTRPFHDEHAGASMLCYDLPIIVLGLRKRLSQKKRARGGRGKRQRFTRHDLAVKPLDSATLPKQIGPLCRLLKREMPRLFRLILEAQDAHEEELSLYWKACHVAIGIALLRVQALWVALRKVSTSWFALVCLRWALRSGWETFCGPRTLSKAARLWLGAVPITLKQERELFRLLLLSGENAGPPPEPFADVVKCWHTDGPPPAPPQGVRDWQEGEQTRCVV